MRHPALLERANTILLIVDVQESFRKHIQHFADLTRAIAILVEASKVLQLPVAVTEQYPVGLGQTASEIAACLGEHVLFEKNIFSCCQQEDFLTWLKSIKRKQIILTGIESHVCVSQTAHDLLSLGYSPHLIVDAIASRSQKNKEIGISKMTQSGAIISSLETALFELLIESGTAEFKAIQRLIK